jgi:hypothetical protein
MLARVTAVKAAILAGSLAATQGWNDGQRRAGSDRYEDFDPRGSFIRRPSLIEADWHAYRDAYEAGYLDMLRVLHRGRFAA